MKLMYIASLLVLAVIVNYVKCDAYKGYKLLSVVAKSEKDVEFLHKLHKRFTDVDFWHGPATAADQKSTMLLPPSLLPTIESDMTERGIKWKEHDVNVTKIIEAGMRKTTFYADSPIVFMMRRQSIDIIDHYNYHEYDKIVSYLHKFKQIYPDNVEVSYLSYPTHEGRNVAMIKLHGAPAISSNKPSIMMESGIHAREWISPAATLYSIEKLLQRYQLGDSKARFILDSFDWYIVPVTNPDGYSFTRKSIDTRLWRKNRRMMRGDCSGVDLNRNFDVYFGTTGVSSNCSSLIYPGVNAFSEPETANIREFFNSINDSIIAYLSVHSYSQFLLVPWSFSNVSLQPDNAEELARVAGLMADAIKATHGKVYEVGTAWDLLEYAASGSSKDWAIYTKPGIYAMTYELRPDREDVRGFNLPPDEIIPTGEEFLSSLEVLALQMKGDN